MFICEKGILWMEGDFPSIPRVTDALQSICFPLTSNPPLASFRATRGFSSAVRVEYCFRALQLFACGASFVVLCPWGAFPWCFYPVFRHWGLFANFLLTYNLRAFSVEWEPYWARPVARCVATFRSSPMYLSIWLSFWFSSAA